MKPNCHCLFLQQSARADETGPCPSTYKVTVTAARVGRFPQQFHLGDPVPWRPALGLESSVVAQDIASKSDVVTIVLERQDLGESRDCHWAAKNKKK